MMAKYRQLTKEELLSFEKEFIDFLVVNGIIADDWVKIKSAQKEKAESIIAHFSDVIFEGIMRKVNYLEFVSPKSIKCFQCLEKEIILVGIDAEQDTEIDFTLENWNKNVSNLKVYTQTKAYHKQRELELFDLVQSGAKINDGKLFKQLCLAL